MSERESFEQRVERLWYDTTHDFTIFQSAARELMVTTLRDLAADDAAVVAINYNGGVKGQTLFAGHAPDEIRSILSAIAYLLESRQ